MARKKPISSRRNKGVKLLTKRSGLFESDVKALIKQRSKKIKEFDNTEKAISSALGRKTKPSKDQIRKLDRKRLIVETEIIGLETTLRLPKKFSKFI